MGGIRTNPRPPPLLSSVGLSVPRFLSLTKEVKRSSPKPKISGRCIVHHALLRLHIIVISRLAVYVQLI